MMLISFDPEKYRQLQKTQGTSAALTALQQDIQVWEFETFEGPKGYQPKIWEEIETARELSRKLWTEASDAFKPVSSSI